MQRYFLIIILFYSRLLAAQELSIIIKEPEPYYMSETITFEVYLTNTTDTLLTVFDSRGPSWDSFNESWDLSVNMRYEELLSLNTAFEGRFTDTMIRTLNPGDTLLIRYKELHLKDYGDYRLTYWQEQNPNLIKKQLADFPLHDSVIQKVAAFKLTEHIEFKVHKPYDTTITELVEMTWEEWKDYRHVQVYTRDHFYDNIYAALKNPQEVYALDLYCNGLTLEEIKRLSRLKNLKLLRLYNYEPDTFPEELTRLNLYELTILPKEDKAIAFPWGFSVNQTLRELRVKLFGSFPASLLEQHELIQLDINDSSLEELPNLSSLKNLELLNASDCDLNTLDNLGLEQLPKLIDLNFSGNREISDISPLLNVTSLEFLVLNRNRITTIPDEIKNLSKLKKLSISNSLTFISDSISTLHDLRLLSLGGNTQLTELPATIINLKKLLNLNLNRTSIGILPEGIAELPFEEFSIQQTPCKVTKDYKELRKRLKDNFKE
ncbi:MAG: leucine-rich repeat domain-containing protein [Salinivirgaceae bacterium]